MPHNLLVQEEMGYSIDCLKPGRSLACADEYRQKGDLGQLLSLISGGGGTGRTSILFCRGRHHAEFMAKEVAAVMGPPSEAAVRAHRAALAAQISLSGCVDPDMEQLIMAGACLLQAGRMLCD